MFDDDDIDGEDDSIEDGGGIGLADDMPDDPVENVMTLTSPKKPSPLPIGSQFGAWTTIGEARQRPSVDGPARVVTVKCSCGIVREMPITALRGKRARIGCGCTLPPKAREWCELSDEDRSPSRKAGRPKGAGGHASLTPAREAAARSATPANQCEVDELRASLARAKEVEAALQRRVEALERQVQVHARYSFANVCRS